MNIKFYFFIINETVRMQQTISFVMQFDNLGINPELAQVFFIEARKEPIKIILSNPGNSKVLWKLGKK